MGTWKDWAAASSLMFMSCMLSSIVDLPIMRFSHDASLAVFMNAWIIDRVLY